MIRSPGATLARALILVYRLTLSAFIGRECRYLPTCSEYADEAIRRHGLWAGGWMGLARICRCRPGGGDGYDPVPHSLRADASPLAPWRYGAWRRPSICEAVELSFEGANSDRSNESVRSESALDQERAISSTASPQMRSRTGSGRPRSASR
jgi:putative membrane protein insertion efficiency factor